MPSKSSITAAPKMICARFPVAIPMSFKTRMVIPMLVAVSVPPMKRDAFKERSNKR